MSSKPQRSKKQPAITYELKRMTSYDFSIVLKLMESLCSKKIAYDSPFLKPISRARNMVFDSLHPWKALRDISELKQVANKELDKRLGGRGLLNEAEQRRLAIGDLTKLWEAERKLRNDLELLRGDMRFKDNGFYRDTLKLLGLGMQPEEEGTAQGIESHMFMTQDLARISDRLEFFMIEMNTDVAMNLLKGGPKAALDVWAIPLAEELGRFGTGFDKDGPPLNRSRIKRIDMLNEQLQKKEAESRDSLQRTSIESFRFEESFRSSADVFQAESEPGGPYNMHYQNCVIS